MNKQKGEILIKLEGKEYILRPSHEAMAAIEGEVGRGILEIGQNVATMKAQESEISAIIFHCARVALDVPRHAMPWSYQDLRKLLYKYGIIKAALLAAPLVNIMLTGETEQELSAASGEGAEKNGDSPSTASL